MGLTLSCDTNNDWNDKILTIGEDKDVIMVSIHMVDEDPIFGTTVKIERKEFWRLCDTFTRITPPDTD